jgi:hypothetical protein
MPLNIVSDAAPVPVTGRARTSAANDPELTSFYNDTLKPRGIPSSSAITLRFDTKPEAEKDLRALRKLAKDDNPQLTIGADLKPEDPNYVDAHNAHLLTVWVRGLFKPREPKDKTDGDFRPQSEPVDEVVEVPAHAEENFDNAPVVEIPTFQEPEPEHENKRKHRFGL